MKRRYDLSEAAWMAYMAGNARGISGQWMFAARLARVDGASRELVCNRVQLARQWHRSYLAWLNKALEAQP